MDEWIHNGILFNAYVMEYYSAMEKNEILLFAAM
jgi:hypothetical protein